MIMLWQTLILRQWKPIFAWLPAETVIRDRQEDYYCVLAKADNLADATPDLPEKLPRSGTCFGLD